MTGDIDQAARQHEANLPETAPHERFLKLVVGGLAVAMVLGIAAIVIMLWQLMNSPPLRALPANVQLPEGARAAAVTFADERLIVVTQAGDVLVYDADGTLTQRIVLDQP